MEDSMEKLKQSYKDAKNENLDLKFELEQAKVQIQQQGCHEECRKKIDSQPEDIFK